MPETQPPKNENADTRPDLPIGMGDQIDTLKVISTGIIIVLFMGFVALIGTLESMRRDADQFKSQLFIDLIKENQATNTKIDTLISNK